MKKFIKLILFLTFITSTQVYPMQDTKPKLVELKKSLRGLNIKLTTLSEKLDNIRVRFEFEELVSQMVPTKKDTFIDTFNKINGDAKLYKILTMEKDGFTIITQLAKNIVTCIRKNEYADMDAYTEMSVNIFKNINKINNNEILTKLMTESKDNNINPFCLIATGFAQYQNIEEDLSTEQIKAINENATLFAQLIGKIDKDSLANVLVKPLTIKDQNLIPLKTLLAPAISTAKLVVAFQIILGEILNKTENFTKTQLGSISSIKISVEELQYFGVTDISNEITLKQFINIFTPDVTFPPESQQMIAKFKELLNKK